jgi:transposase
MDESKMSALEKLVESLGNVSSACARLGVSRSLYYKWKARRSAEAGVKARKRRHPQATQDAVRARILEIAIQNPEWGCDRISYFLELKKLFVSGTTVQKILRANAIGSISERQRKRARG